MILVISGRLKLVLRTREVVVMATVVETTDKTFEADTAKGVTLTDFWATWCGPCRMQSPVVEQLADEMGDQVTFNKMDVDANRIHHNPLGS